jgi:hypothetical protein
MVRPLLIAASVGQLGWLREWTFPEEDRHLYAK